MVLINGRHHCNNQTNNGHCIRVKFLSTTWIVHLSVLTMLFGRREAVSNPTKIIMFHLNSPMVPTHRGCPMFMMTLMAVMVTMMVDHVMKVPVTTNRMFSNPESHLRSKWCHHHHHPHPCHHRLCRRQQQQHYHRLLMLDRNSATRSVHTPAYQPDQIAIANFCLHH